MGQMHGSRPAGMRCLAALRRLGGSATSWELATALRTHHLSADVASCRDYLEEVGCCREALRSECVGVDEDGRQVWRYSLSREAFWGLRQRLLFATEARRPQKTADVSG